jgi:hypothetical protein
VVPVLRSIREVLVDACLYSRGWQQKPQNHTRWPSSSRQDNGMQYSRQVLACTAKARIAQELLENYSLPLLAPSSS